MVTVNAFEYALPCPLGSHGAMARITTLMIWQAGSHYPLQYYNLRIYGPCDESMITVQVAERPELRGQIGE